MLIRDTRLPAWNKDGNEKNIVVVMASGDDSDEKAKMSHEGMPWCMVPREATNALKQKFGLSCWPFSVIINAKNGEVLVQKANQVIRDSGAIQDAFDEWMSKATA